ncbi:MAG: hypothetical protein QME51_00280 [Planctomycetota bacterium]|nr:hypothetical protein [Planctomycetota bacterium]MDI6786796.1 hypothetical protein [Planctomycetota bacterium]
MPKKVAVRFTQHTPRTLTPVRAERVIYVLGSCPALRGSRPVPHGMVATKTPPAPKGEARQRRQGRWKEPVRV